MALGWKESSAIRLLSKICDNDIKNIWQTICQITGCKLVFHRVKSVFNYLEGLKLSIPLDRVIDLSICDYLIDPNSSKHDIASIIKRFQQRSEEYHPTLENNCFQILHTWDKVWKILDNMDLTNVYREIEIPLMPVLARMEKYGIYVDVPFLQKYSKKLTAQLKKIEREIIAEAGEEFNILSTKQLQQILFEKLKVHQQLGVKRIKKNKTGYSTDESVLTQLSGHPIPKMVLEYRSLSKLLSTYIDALPSHISKETNRLHTTFHQTVAATGRLSSDNPNLQNIPMRTKEGREIRKAFRPSNKDYIMISADYSQVELRLLAEFSKADDLARAFADGLDVHTATASKIFAIPFEKVTPDIRSRAKAVNFGILYGMGPQRLAKETGVSLQEAKDFIEKYFNAYPEIKKYTTSLIKSAKDKGYSVTCCGRKRPIIGLNDGNSFIRSRAENIAVNSPIQGSAADLIKVAMIHIDEQFRTNHLKARILLQIHDELLVEGPKKEKKQIMEIMIKCMEAALDFKIPMKVEIDTGENWFDAH